MAKTSKKAEKPEGKVTTEQFEQSAAQAIQNYFTREVNDQIRDMTMDVMYTKLRQLEVSEYWIAILKYINQRLLNAQSAINTIDPITNPSMIRKLQGNMEGLIDLQNCVIIMVESEKSAEEEAKAISENF